jgi:hypothetical protein
MQFRRMTETLVDHALNSRGCSPSFGALAVRREGIVVCEDRCSEQLDLVRSWLTLDHQECASWLLRDYMDRFRGGRFDKLANGDSPPDVITDSDLDAVRALSIRFPPGFQPGSSTR